MKKILLSLLFAALPMCAQNITVYPSNCGPGDGSGNFRCVGMPLASYPDNVWINWLPSQPSHFIQVSDSAQNIAFTAYDLLRVDNGSGPAVFTFTVTDGLGHVAYNGVATIAYHAYRGCTSGRGAHCGPYLRQDGGTITLTLPAPVGGNVRGIATPLPVGVVQPGYILLGDGGSTAFTLRPGEGDGDSTYTYIGGGGYIGASDEGTKESGFRETSCGDKEDTPCTDVVIELSSAGADGDAPSSFSDNETPCNYRSVDDSCQRTGVVTLRSGHTIP